MFGPDSNKEFVDTCKLFSLQQSEAGMEKDKRHNRNEKQLEE